MYTFSPHEPGALHGYLKLVGSDTKIQNMGPDVEGLTIDACNETDSIVAVRIGAPNRWSVPQTVLPRQAPSHATKRPENHQNSENCKVYIDEDPFAFEVYTNSSEQAIFSTKGHEFIFCEQYIQFSSTLPEHPNIYGLGEVNSSFRRLVSASDDEFEPGTVTTLWARGM